MAPGLHQALARPHTHRYPLTAAEGDLTYLPSIETQKASHSLFSFKINSSGLVPKFSTKKVFRHIWWMVVRSHLNSGSCRGSMFSSFILYLPRDASRKSKS